MQTRQLPCDHTLSQAVREAILAAAKRALHAYIGQQRLPLPHEPNGIGSRTAQRAQGGVSFSLTNRHNGLLLEFFCLPFR
jgi:hypothetical protein